MKKLIVLLIILTMCVPVYAVDYSENIDWRKYEGTSINVYNWGEYIAVDEGDPDEFDLNKEFTRLTGIRVNYTNFASNRPVH